MEIILDFILTQIKFLLKISSEDRTLLINIFEIVKKRKIPFQLPFTREEIELICAGSTHTENFLALKFDGIKNTDIIMAGIYAKFYSNNQLYIGSSNTFEEREFRYWRFDSVNKHMKELDKTLLKNNQPLPFLPILMYSISYTYYLSLNEKEKQLIKHINLLEEKFIGTINKLGIYSMLNIKHLNS